MSELKNKKYYALLGIVLLVVAIIGLFAYGKVDKYEGLVKIKKVSTDTRVLSASVLNTVDQSSTSRGSDEIRYKINYTLDTVSGVTTRDVIIKGTLNESESKYARFKKVRGNNITSTLSNNDRTIEIEVRDVPLGQENEITLLLVITNAPNGYTVNPNLSIKEATENDETVINTQDVVVSTRSITGVVADEKNIPVRNVELSLNDVNGEIKRTYTDENGNYIFSDITDGTYRIDLEEEIYELTSQSIIEGEGELNLKVKEVTPYEIEAHKYITNLDLVINGREEHYSYNDLEKVVQTVKNAKTISGEITYKITLKNIGGKVGKLSMLKDKVDDGLKFDATKNSGWELKEKGLYYSAISNVSIAPLETREIILKLDIKDTNEIKTYINTINANGDTYEKVVYILDGVKYKEENVLLGETIKEEVIQDDRFTGWYTDKNLTNKYNFNNEVTKDLILYGHLERPTYNIKFVDKNPSTGALNPWSEQNVEEGEKATEPASPSHTGYKFECWMDEHDNIWDFDVDTVQRDMTLTSCYSVIRYEIKYHGLTEQEETALNNPKYYTIEDTVSITDANDRYEDNLLSERFTGWTGSNGNNPSKGITFSNETGDKDYTANWETVEPDEYRIDYVLNGGELEAGKTNPSKYTKKTPTFTLNNPTKPHHNFLGWTGSNGNVPELEVTMVKGENEGDKEFIANFEMITHRVTFKDKDPENPTIETSSDFGQPVTVNDGDAVDAPQSNPIHTGFTCDRWSTKIDGDYNDDAYNFNNEVASDLVLYTLCKRNTYTVTFETYGGTPVPADQTVEYNRTATEPETDPNNSANHKIFLYWSENQVDPYNFNTLVTGNKTLHAIYETVEPPVISHTPTIWTNQDVTVTVTNQGTDGKDYTGYTYQYRKEDEGLHSYTSAFPVEKNMDVYAVSVKSEVLSEEVKHEIRNIDKVKPTIVSLNSSNISYNSFNLDIQSYDSESGLKTIDIYNSDDDTFIHTINFTYTPENGGPTTEQSSSYTLTGLTPDTVYNIKIVVTDVAGNITESEPITVKTLVNDRIVAQITHHNGVELANYIPLNSVYRGLTYNEDGINCGVSNQCTIQMLDSVAESNVILEGQDITLDLNGFTINNAPTVDYTFNNNGDFTVIDSTDSEGSILNSVDTAITNSGNLTLGIDDPELNISKTSPYIEGLSKGIVNTGNLDFYDGKVVGLVAISGEPNGTPRWHRVSVTQGQRGEERVYIATLEVIEDAEARIDNTYYTRVSEAVLDAKGMSYVPVKLSKSFMSEGTIKKDGEYGFGYSPAYMSTPAQYYAENNNSDKYYQTSDYSNTSAKGKFDIDLTEYENDQEFFMDIKYYYSYDSYNQGNPIYDETRQSWTVTIKDEDNNVVYTYTSNEYNYAGKIIKTLLPKGKLYTVYVSSDIITANSQQMYIRDMYLKDYILEESSLPQDLTIINNDGYGFAYDSESGTYTSQNNVQNSVANGEFYINLTDKQVDQDFIIDYTVNGYSQNYTILICEDGPDGTVVYNNTSSATGALRRVYELEKGKEYYVKLSFTNNAYSLSSAQDTKMIITNMFYQEHNATDVDLSDNIKSDNVTIYKFIYDEETKSYKSNNQYVNNNTAYSYIEVDLTNEPNDKLLSVNALLESYSERCYGSIRVTEDNNYNDEDSSALLFMKGKYNKYNKVGPYLGTKVLTHGKKYYIQFYYKKDDYNNLPSQSQYASNNNRDQFIINNLRIVDNYDNSDLTSDTSTTETNLKPSIVTDDAYGFTCGSYDCSPTNYGVDNTVAHSYVPIDLTDVTTPKYVRFKLSTGKYNFKVVVNDSSTMPSDDEPAEIYNTSDKKMNDSYTYYAANLIPGKVNYLHLISKYNNGDSSLSINKMDIFDGKIIMMNKLETAGEYGYSLLTGDYGGGYIPVSLPQGNYADSYVKIDLSNETQDQLVTANVYMKNSNNVQYMYITKNKKNIPYSSLSSSKRNDALVFFDYNAVGYPYYSNNGNGMTGDYKNFSFVLPKGNVYYLHFATYANSALPYSSYAPYDNLLAPKSVKLMPVSNLSNSKIGKITVNEGTESSFVPDYVNTPTEDNSFRYIGKNPKNYISFNNELWRIIGVFETEDENGNTDRRIKIVRNDSIGNYIWDTSDGSVNNGYGVNEWSQADIMKLLNPGYDSEAVGGSLYWNSQSGTCYNGGGNGTGNCDFTSNGLNSTSKQYIDSVKWYTGSFNTPKSSLNPVDLYAIERSNNKGNDDVTGGDSIPRTTSWIGKVGLIYPSDYFSAMGDGLGYTRTECMNNNYSDCSANNSWIAYGGNPMYTISPTNAGLTGSTSPYTAVGITGYDVSGMYTMNVNNQFQIKPTVYLSTKVEIDSGTGTSDDPYRIKLGSSKNTKTNYGLDESDIDDVVYTDESDILDENIATSKPSYGFEYDSESDMYVNTNAKLKDTLAVSYVTFDLRNVVSSVPKKIKIMYSLDSGNNNVYINRMVNTLREINYNDYNSYNSGLITNLYGTKEDYFFVDLYPGNINYIQFAYNNTNNTANNITDTFKFKIVEYNGTDEETEFKVINLLPAENNPNYYYWDVEYGGEPKTVQILKNINMPSSLEVESDNHMILDLNGYTLSTEADDYVIKNSGELKIIDTKFEDNKANFETQKVQNEIQYNEDFQTLLDKYNNCAETDYITDGLILNYRVKDNNIENVIDLTGNYETNRQGTTITTGTPVDYNNFTITFGKMRNDNLVFNGNNFSLRDDLFRIDNSEFSIKFESGTKNLNFTNKLNEIQKRRKNARALRYGEETVTYDESKLILYFNGEKVDEIDVSEDSLDINSRNKLVYYLESAGNNKGLSIMIYNRALTEEEIQTNFMVDRKFLFEDTPVKEDYVEEFDNTEGVGSVFSASNSVILNNANSYLEIESGNVSIDTYTSGSYYDAITNYGNLKLGDNGYININNYNQTGINNLENGDILDGSGHIYAPSYKGSYAVKNQSSDTTISGIDTKFSDIMFKNNTITFNNINMFAGNIGKSNQNVSNLVINNSKITDSTLYTGTSITLNNSKFIADREFPFHFPRIYSNNVTLNESSIEWLTQYKWDDYVDQEDAYNYSAPKYGLPKLKVDNLLTITDSNIIAEIEYKNINASESNIIGTISSDGLNGTSDLLTNVDFMGSILKHNGSMTIDGGSYEPYHYTSNKKNPKDIYLGNKNLITFYGEGDPVLQIKGNTTVGNEDTQNAIDMAKYFGGNLIIGDNSNSVSDVYPIITSQEKGINIASDNSVFNFYDGKIISNNETAIISTINEIPTDYDIERELDGAKETIYLVSDDTREYVAQIGSTKYRTLNAAIDAASTSSQTTIEIIRDFITMRSHEIPNNKDIVIDYKGHSIDFYGNDALYDNKGSLKIEDSTNNPKENQSNGLTYLKNNGTAEINGLVIRMIPNNIKQDESHRNIDDTTTIVNNESGTTTIIDVEAYIPNYDRVSSSIIFKNSSVLNIDSININSNYIVNINNDSTGTLNIATAGLDKLEVTGSSDYLIINNDGITNIEDGSIKTMTINNNNELTINNELTDRQIRVNSYGDKSISITDSKIRDIYLYENSGAVITNSSFVNLYNNNSSKVEIIDSNTSSIDSDVYGNNIYNYNGEEIAISNSTVGSIINEKYTYNGSRYYKDTMTELYAGIINIDESTTGGITNNGTINVTNSSIINKGNGNAITNEDYGVVNIGIKDGDSDVSGNTIKGNTNGITNSSTGVVNFYDGIIKGRSLAINTDFNDIEEDYNVISEYITEDGNSYESKYLSKEDLPAFKINGKGEYNTFAEALAVADIDDTIILTRKYNQTSTITIPSSKSISFDLNGNQFISTVETLFDNSGTLNIVNSHREITTSMIGASDQTTILNNTTGTLTMNGINLSTWIQNNGRVHVPVSIDNQGTADIQYTNKIYNIDNTGTLTIENSSVYGIVNNTNDLTSNYNSVNYYTNTGTLSVYYQTNNVTVRSTEGSVEIEGALDGSVSISSENQSVSSIKDSTLGSVSVDGDARLSINNLTNTGLDLNGSSYTSIKNLHDGQKIYVRDTANLEYESGNNKQIISTTSGTINIGKNDGNVEQNKVIINSVGLRGNNSPYYAINSCENTILNIYDGKFISEKDFGTGENHTASYIYSSIRSTVNSVETGYNIDTSVDSSNNVTNFLSNNDLISLIKPNGTTTGYNILSEAFNDATSGDTIKLLNHYQTLKNDTTITIPSGKSLTLDLNGKMIVQNNNNLFTNNGTLTVLDSTVTVHSSGYYLGSGSIFINNDTSLDSTVDLNNTFINNGTLNINSGLFGNVIKRTLRYDSNDSGLLIEDDYYISEETKYEFTYQTSLTNESIIDDYSYNLRSISIQNTGSLNLNGGYIGGIINNSNAITIGNKMYVFAGISNTSTGSITTTNGKFDTGAIDNFGSLTIDGTSFDNFSVIRNHSVNTSTISNASINNSRIINTNSLLEVNDSTILSSSVTNKNGTININRSDLSNSNITTYYDMTLTDCYSNYNPDKWYKVSLSGATESSNLTVDGGTYNIMDIRGKFNNITIKDITITSLNAADYPYYSNLDFTFNSLTIEDSILNNALLTLSGDMYPRTGNKTANIIDSTIRLSSTNFNYEKMINLKDFVNLNVKGSSSLINEYGTAITSKITNGIDNVNIGDKDGIVSTTEPVIRGSNYGINDSDENLKINFYDGQIMGQNKPYTSGIISDTEERYRPVISEETIDSVLYQKATLTLSGEVEKVAEVNGINYDSLEGAINVCPTDGSECIVTIFVGINLEAPLVVPAGANIKVYLNGFTISPQEYVTNHTGEGSIELISGSPSGLGGSIYRFLANITGTKINPKNIIIYQMEDGNELDPADNYKLYRLIDGEYKLVKVDENSIGYYEIGKETTDLRTVNGQLRVNGIGEGEYKLVGGGRELEFSITENGISNNIRENRYASKAKVTATAIATLILQLQTGVMRKPYIVLILLVVILVLGAIALNQKQKREDYEK